MHVLVIALAVRQGEALWSAPPAAGNLFQPLGGGGSAGGGGGGATYISLPPLPAAAPASRATVEAAPPKPVPAKRTPVVHTEPVTPVKPEPRPEPPPAPVVTPAPDTATTVAARSDSSAARAPAAGPGAGPGATPGTGPGTGGGTGGGAGTGAGPGAGPGTGGNGGTITPPTPRTFALTLDGTPKDLRGRQILVTFWVNADGSVARVETDPEIKDADYRRRFLDVALATRFHPARSPAGLAVAASTTMTYTLPTK